MASAAPLRIGIIGGGTVGGGVYELLKTASSRISIEKICVRSLTKPRDFSAPASLFTTNPQDILDNASIDCVVEVMGGTGLAKTIVLEALQKGKSVVTANKALMAESLDELQTAAIAAQKPLLYEAAVCGGIPIITILSTAYTGDVITSIQGIANGTTNFMLTKMAQEGADYNAVLKEAQDLGYAEADPTADVEGHDVRAKLALMAKLAYGTTIVPESMTCTGISQMTAADFAYAASLNSTIKLLGTAARREGSDSVSIHVLPTMVPQTHFLASVHGSGNAVAVTSKNMGSCLYTGPGAGRFPTANSIVADVWRIANSNFDKSCNPFSKQTSSLKITNEFTSPFYIRVNASNATAQGTIEKMLAAHAVVVEQRLSQTAVGTLAWTVESCSYPTIVKLTAALEASNIVTAVVTMPILDA